LRVGRATADSPAVVFAEPVGPVDELVGPEDETRPEVGVRVVPGPDPEHPPIATATLSSAQPKTPRATVRIPMKPPPAARGWNRGSRDDIPQRDGCAPSECCTRTASAAANFEGTTRYVPRAVMAAPLSALLVT